MKILLVHNFYPVIGGGEDSVVEEERSMLEHAGHKVVPFFVYTKERGLMDFIFSALCLVWNPVAYRKMALMLKREQPDIVHCHNTFPLISPAIYWACRRQGITVIQTLHNYRLVCANGLFLRQGAICEACSGRTFAWPAIRYRCYRGSVVGSLLLVMMQWIHRVLGTWRKKVDCYIALTDFARSRFVESGVLPEEKIVVKPNFIADPYASGNDIPKKQQAVFIGRLWPEKGCHILVEAWGKALEQSPRLNGYELVIIGDGPQRAQAERLCGKHSAQSSVRFTGTLPREDVLRTLKESRFLILPSIWYEGFPMTIVESFACGIPILSANIGSMQSIVAEGESGLLFEVGNVDQLADRIVWAVAHEREMEEMGRNARSEYEAKYTGERNYDCIVKLYGQLRKGTMVGSR